MEKELIGQATPEQIAQWKDDPKNKGLFALPGGGHIAYFRDPDFDDLNFAASQVDSDAPLEFNKIVMRETFVGGSMAIIDEQRLFMGASKKIAKKIDGEKFKLVEL